MAEKDWQQGKSLNGCFKELLTNGLWSDITFSFTDNGKKADVTVAAHKLVLAARSPVYQAMFYGPLAEKNIVISLPDTDSKTFSLFMRYLYTDETDLTEDNVSEVIQLAHKYQVTSLLNYCYEYLKTVLKPDNACAILELALFLGDKQLEKDSIRFIDDHAEKVMQSNEFYDLQPKTLEYILKGDTFVADEKLIATAALKWAKNRCLRATFPVSGKNMRTVLGSAFKYIRFPVLSASDFSKVTYRQGLLSLEETEETVSYITGNKEAKPLNSTRQRRKWKEIVRPKHFKDIVAREIEFEKEKQIRSVIKVKSLDSLKLTGVKMSGLIKSTIEPCFAHVILSNSKSFVLNAPQAKATSCNLDFKTMKEKGITLEEPLQMTKNQELYVFVYLTLSPECFLMAPKLSSSFALAAHTEDLDDVLMREIYGVENGIKILEAHYNDNWRIVESLEYECSDYRY